MRSPSAAPTTNSRWAGNDDRGSGSLLAIAIVAATLACVMLVLPFSAVLVARARVTGAADAAALAAADAASGISPGIPCRIASAVARANGGELRDCLADGVIVTVRVSTAIFGFPVSSSATAGPASAGR